MKKLLFALVAIITAISSNVAYCETEKTTTPAEVRLTTRIPKNAQEPTIHAESAILIEKNTGYVLYNKEAEKAMYPASTTKIMTAMVFLDYFDENEIVTVGNEVREVSLDSSKAGHSPRESITAKNLVRGLMIPSGNDSGVVVACAVAKKIKNDDTLSLEESEEIFAELMNKKAQEIGCVNTHFVNPHGYHDENHYTCASDMAKISVKAMENALIRQIVSEKEFSGGGLEGVEKESGMRERQYNWTSHNLLITNSDYNYPYANGIKTGFTDEAGDSVVASAKKDNIELIAVIYNSDDPNRWIDAKELFEYGFNNFGYFTLNKNGDSVSTVNVVYNKSADDNTIDLLIKEDIILYISKIELGAITPSINITNTELLYTKEEQKEGGAITLKAPIVKDTEIGKIQYISSDGSVLAETKLYTSKDIEKANIFQRILYKVKEFAIDFVDQIDFVRVAIILAVVVIIFIIYKIIKGRRRRYYPRKKYKFKKTKRGKF